MKVLAKCFRRMSRQLFEEADKVGHILITQLESDLVHLVGCGEEVSFGFQEDLVVNKVGHERENALAEVRRSFSGDYGPLYQMAYMMGGLQFYALHRDLVGGKKMSDRQFHDAILKEGSIPVEMVRAILTKQKLTKDFRSAWRYYPGLAN